MTGRRRATRRSGGCSPRRSCSAGRQYAESPPCAGAVPDEPSIAETHGAVRTQVNNPPRTTISRKRRHCCRVATLSQRMGWPTKGEATKGEMRCPDADAGLACVRTAQTVVLKARVCYAALESQGDKDPVRRVCQQRQEGAPLQLPTAGWGPTAVASTAAIAPAAAEPAAARSAPRAAAPRHLHSPTLEACKKQCAAGHATPQQSLARLLGAAVQSAHQTVVYLSAASYSPASLNAPDHR